ncbi:MAG TPA: acyl-CoA thioesterase [Bacteroidetes bacterium]|nr:acyl-CoA thioesterase [Bacteroidota bacterium]
MIQHETQIRVRYAETDQMGIVYYGIFPQYFEVGRAELIRSLGLTYRDMEVMGILMPVTDLRVRYLRPAHYDEMLRVRTTIAELPTQRIGMDGEVFNEKGKLVVAGRVTLTFMSAKTRKTIPPPTDFMNILKAHWE